MHIFLVTAVPDGLWGQIRDDDYDDAPSILGERKNPHIVGAVLGTEWTFSSGSGGGVFEKNLREVAQTFVSSGRLLHGYIENDIKKLCMLVDPVAISDVRISVNAFNDAVAGADGLAWNVDDTEPPDYFTKWSDTMFNWSQFALHSTVVSLSPAFCGCIFQPGGSSLLNSVVLSKPMNRSKLLITTTPTKKKLKDLRERGGCPSFHARGGRGARRKNTSVKTWHRKLLKCEISAELVIDLMRCSSFLKQQKQCWKVSWALLRVVRKHGFIKIPETMSAIVPTISTELLRLGRVRLDCVSMLLWMKFFDQLMQSGEFLNFVLYCDTSPQWRGIELFASTIDIATKNESFRLLLPVIGLSRWALGITGKCVGLLWKLFLICVCTG